MRLRLAPYLRKPPPIFATGEPSAYYTSGKHRIHADDSGRYFVRREPFPKWKRIRYYTLEGDSIPLSKGTCKECGETIESKYCGDFQQCKCGRSYVDTDRWEPERHRFGGAIEFNPEGR